FKLRPPRGLDWTLTRSKRCSMTLAANLRKRRSSSTLFDTSTSSPRNHTASSLKESTLRARRLTRESATRSCFSGCLRFCLNTPSCTSMITTRTLRARLSTGLMSRRCARSWIAWKALTPLCKPISCECNKKSKHRHSAPSTGLLQSVKAWVHPVIPTKGQSIHRKGVGNQTHTSPRAMHVNESTPKESTAVQNLNAGHHRHL
ncbi:hypothetical protein BGX31_006156, partial [Mortierella sp. GBA43]